MIGFLPISNYHLIILKKSILLLFFNIYFGDLMMNYININFICYFFFFSSFLISQNVSAMNEEEEEVNLYSTEAGEKKTLSLSAQEEELGPEWDELFSSAPNLNLLQEQEQEEKEKEKYVPRKLSFGEDEEECEVPPSSDNPQNTSTIETNHLSKEDEKELAEIENRLYNLVPYAFKSLDVRLNQAKQFKFEGVPESAVLVTESTDTGGRLEYVANKVGIHAYALGHLMHEKRRREESESTSKKNKKKPRITEKKKDKASSD
jgi:hypothetical protein